MWLRRTAKVELLPLLFTAALANEEPFPMFPQPVSVLTFDTVFRRFSV